MPGEPGQEIDSAEGLTGDSRFNLQRYPDPGRNRLNLQRYPDPGRNRLNLQR
jgi:hypothetical protein